MKNSVRHIRYKCRSITTVGTQDPWQTGSIRMGWTVFFGPYREGTVPIFAAYLSQFSWDCTWKTGLRWWVWTSSIQWPIGQKRKGENAAFLFSSRANMSATPFFVFVLLLKVHAPHSRGKGGQGEWTGFPRRGPSSGPVSCVVVVPSCAAEAESYARNVCRGAEVFLRVARSEKCQQRAKGRKTTQLLSVSDFGEVEDPADFSVHIVWRS